MTHPPKAETRLALRLLEERRAQHQANLDGWTEPNGYLVPTEPDADERVKIRALLTGAIHELSYLLSADPAPPVPASAGPPCWSFAIADLATTLHDAVTDATDVLGDALSALAGASPSTSPVRSAEMESSLPAPAWQPIETFPDDFKRDGTVALRPHFAFGPMDVRWKPGMYDTPNGKKHMNWINGDYTTAWPEEAFLPFWMSLSALPSPPASPPEEPR
jgi:hypothetical protein